MGKKLQGAKLRAKKRSKLAAQESLETKATETETQQVTTKANEELFVLDTTAILPSKKQLEKKEKKEKKKRKFTNSAKEEAQINKLVDIHSPTKLKELAKIETSKRAKIKKDVNPKFDLWGDDDTNAKNKKKRKTRDNNIKKVPHPGIGPSLAGTKPDHKPSNYSIQAMPAPNKTKTVAIDVAESGQSYNPDRIQHKDVIKKAVTVEEKRQKAEEYKTAPISAGMSEETKAYLLDDSDLEDYTDSENEEEPKEKRPIDKKKEKLTRAQRNRQKRIRKEQFELQQRKKAKKFQNSVGEAKNISKQLRKEAAEKEKKAEELRKLKEASERTKGKDVYHQLADENPLHAPTYPVALSSELQDGSLRTLKPKGSLVMDRMASFLDRGMATKKQLKQRRRVQGKRRRHKVKVRGKGFEATKEGGIMG